MPITVLPVQVLDSPDLLQRWNDFQGVICIEENSPGKSNAVANPRRRPRWRAGSIHPPCGSVLELSLSQEVTREEFGKLRDYWSMWKRQPWTSRRHESQPVCVFVPSVPLWAADLFEAYSWDDSSIDAVLRGTLDEDPQPDVVAVSDASSTNSSAQLGRLAVLERDTSIPEMQWLRSHRGSRYTLKPIPSRSSKDNTPMITRYSPQWNSGVASWSEEEGSEEPPCVPENPSNLRLRLDMITKWGRCWKCKASLRPHIFRSGQRQGSLTLMCSRWFHKTGSGARQCWGQRPFDMSRFSELSGFLQREYKSLPSLLGRNSR
eukprot:s830_g36.t1